MTEETSKKLLELTAESYKKISRPFSDTRNRVWTDCTAFEHVVKRGARVLDVGCGNGKLVPWLMERGVSSYVGIDLNPNFIKIASDRYADSHVAFVEGDLLTLDEYKALRGKSFDVVLCIAVLHHLPSESMRVKALTNLKQRVAQGGVVCMTNWNLFQIFGASKSVWKYARARKKTGDDRLYADLSWRDLLTHWKSGEVDEVLYYYAYTARELENLFRKAGFTSVTCWYNTFGTRKHWWDGRNILTIAS